MNRKIIKFLGVLLVGILLYSCGTSRPGRLLTERLFLEPSRISITHPGGSSTGGAVLSEQVNYTQVAMDKPDEPTIQHGSDRLDTSRVYVLPQVMVTSRTRFASIREGHVAVDFVIHVPKPFISDDYQISLTPELLVADSVVAFGDVVLRGKHFVKKQEEDYARYEDYLASLVDSSAYNTAFVDHKMVNKELKERRKAGLNDFQHRFKYATSYEQWLAAQEVENNKYNADQKYKHQQMLADARIQYDLKLRRRLGSGKDTLRLNRQYEKKRRRLEERVPEKRQISLNSVPKKYRDAYLQSLRPEEVRPLLPYEEDSVQLASEHLLGREIALNEERAARKEEMFKLLVPSPYIEDAHYSLVLSEGHNFTYRYTKEYPVTSNLRNFRLTMKGRITATDRSGFPVQPVDTLTFLISSLDELADGKLLINPDFTEEQRTDYAFGLQLLRNREYDRALNILNPYKDYNTALALTCTGDHQGAWKLLTSMPANGNVYYLAAIICVRMKDDRGAVEMLKNAVKADGDKLFRLNHDSEIASLVDRYNLKGELEKLTVGN